MNEKYQFRHVELSRKSGASVSEDSWSLTPPGSDEPGLLRLLFYFESTGSGGWRFGSAGRHCFVISLVESGTFMVRSSEGVEILKRGACSVPGPIPSGCRESCTPRETTHRVGVGFARDAASLSLVRSLFPTNRIQCVDVAAASRIFQRIREEITDGGCRRTVLSILLFELMQELHFQYRQRQTPDRLSLALDFMHANLNRPVSMEETALHCGLSVRGLTELFRRQLGESPGHYLLRRRILFARELLALNTMTVSEAAQRAGFCNSSYLYRLLKKFPDSELPQ